MGSRATAIRVSLILALVVLAIGCSRPYVNRYFTEISGNQQALARLVLGMSAADVRGIMGEGELVRYKKLHLVDPWRTESFYLTDGTGVLILYYVTTRPRRYNAAEDANLTPIVLENERLVGWGWSFLNRNTDRYQVAAPKEQK